MKASRIIVCDIDNCISHDQWRHHLIVPAAESPYNLSWTRWHQYHLSCVYDKAAFISEMDFNERRKYEVFFFTAMPEAYRKLRTRWFLRNGRRPSADHIWMRANYDDRPTVDVKRDMVRLLENRRGKGCIFTAYDDRKDILKMYAEEFGINAIHRSLSGEDHNDN